MKEYLRMGLTLGILGAICAGVLSFVNELTAPVIAYNIEQESYSLYYEIFEDAGESADDFSEIDPDFLSDIQADYPGVQDVLQAELGGETVGYVFNVVSSGYGGEMVNSIIFDLEGNIVGYRNISNGETPGFGAVINEEEYYSRYIGKSVGQDQDLETGSSGDNQVEAVSGASFTTKAVMEGLNQAVDAYQDYILGQ